MNTSCTSFLSQHRNHFFPPGVVYVQNAVQRDWKSSSASTGTCGVVRGGLQDFSSLPTPRRVLPKKSQNTNCSVSHKRKAQSESFAHVSPANHEIQRITAKIKAHSVSALFSINDISIKDIFINNLPVFWSSGMHRNFGLDGSEYE